MSVRPLHSVRAAGGIAFLLTVASCAPTSTPLDPNLGGRQTVADTSRLAFSYPMPGLTRAQRETFAVGNNFFADNWVMAPSSTSARDGLGPTFNARSCGACHDQDGRGRPPLRSDEPFLSMLVRLSVTGSAENGAPLPDPHYGGQLQPFGITGIPGEGTPSLIWEETTATYPDGATAMLVSPELTISDLHHGPLSSGLLTSLRVAPAMTGLGLLEAISESTLRASEDPNDLDGDGISGRIHWVMDTGGEMQIGRFGWKAAEPSVRDQSAGAFLGDMGITTSLHPANNCPEGQTACQESYFDGMPDASDAVLDAIVFYSRTLAVPQMRNSREPDVMRGSELFDQVGCSNCHVRRIETGNSDIVALNHQSIQPFTDMLLHDMGEGLADGRPDHDASGAEWRTAPLWGIGLVEVVNRHTRFLHDGRARNLEEAVLWHGGEAENAKRSFTQLSSADRARLLRFVGSL